MKLPSIAEIRKFLVVVLGVAGMVVTAGLVHGRLLIDLDAGIAVLTSLTAYQVPNAPGKPQLGDPVFAPEQAAPATPAAPLVVGTAAPAQTVDAAPPTA